MIRMVDIKSYDSPAPNFGNETEAFLKDLKIRDGKFVLGKSGKKFVFS